jgi:hypothetical protein
VYDRTYGDQVLTFEASGGLINSSLVLQDRETDSFWSIMRGQSLEGELQGQPLQEIAQNRKMRWSEWRALHPDTLILSVNGSEDTAPGYDAYFESSEGFRGAAALDSRLETKTPIFAFRLSGQSYAIEHASIVAGKSLLIDGESVFLFRSNDDELHDSTRAFQGRMNNCEFQDGSESFSGANCPQPLTGFDTFWYNWSLNNPDTELIR